MVVDLHSHYIPLEAANEADVGIRFESAGDGAVRFSAPHQQMTLEGQLFDLDRQRADMARQRLGRRMLVIPPFCFQYELPAELGSRWAKALNDGVARAAASDSRHFVGFGTVPLQDIPVAIEELERIWGDLRLAGIEIGSNINGLELDDEALEPFWERVDALELLVLVHPHYIVGAERLGEYYLRNLLGNPYDTAIAATRLVLGGVLERHRNLKIILSHGGGAFPFVMSRVLHGYAGRPEAKLRAGDPADAARRLYYDTIVFQPGALRFLVDTFGPSQVILGTDYPFDMGMEQPVEFVERAGLPDETVRQILANGARLLES